MTWETPTQIIAPESPCHENIFFRILPKIFDALDSGDIDKFQRDVELLDDYLSPYHDDRYKKETEKAKAEYMEKTKGMRPENAAERLFYKKTWLRKIFRSLIKLINRSGFMPPKEVEGVIDEFDAEVKEEEIKDGITETTIPPSEGSDS